MIVRELELDLDAFEGPFDLLLTLVLKEELDLADVDVAGIVLRFVERLAERDELDLEACGEFLILVAALMELKARGLFPDEEAELAELEPEEAAKVKSMPGSLDQALDALEKDHDFLLRGDVFTKDVIETWLDYKRTKEVDAIRLRPHPYEFALYYDI